jgi:hypothetical protein
MAQQKPKVGKMKLFYQASTKIDLFISPKVINSRVTCGIQQLRDREMLQ